ncbi:hypothetical protein RMAECT_0121 [Rickettsia rhipicephali str. Ect]|uniref:Uncharacterized protein n=1 Tax=Rickettsia rhipicephali str. Ect TaxID=1359199 RepID=A0A0F3PER9_RICRH|nr:hypothetical protein RMAECT_0121 [Rickettsia rhipicephali str. Ect]
MYLGILAWLSKTVYVIPAAAGIQYYLSTSLREGIYADKAIS